MDDPGLGAAEHARALVALRRINTLSNSAGILWPAVAALARRTPGRLLRLLDVATGGGDVPVSLLRRAARAGLRLEATGIDVSPTALDAARRRADEAGVPLALTRHDALANELPGGFDVVTSSLFLHHLTDDDAVSLLRRMAAAGGAVLVNDLHRCRAGHALAWAVSRLLTRSKVVHYDAPQSVAAAFTAAEALELAGRAGLAGAAVRRRWPYRWLLEWHRSGDR
jgi:2-polyprenyl-3-methyl-5-hydroxy-6-metoxy-1,4-benzoquinol methylase